MDTDQDPDRMPIPIRIWIRQNDADPAGSGTITLHYIKL